MLSVSLNKTSPFELGICIKIYKNDIEIWKFYDLAYVLEGLHTSYSELVF